jgi:hypothetical protein
MEVASVAADFLVAAGQPIRATHSNQYARWLLAATKKETSLESTHASEYALTVTSGATGNILKLVAGTVVVAAFAAASVSFTAPASALTGFGVAGGLSVNGGFQLAHSATGTTPASGWSALYPITNGTWERRTATNATFTMLDSSLTATTGTLIVGNGANSATGVPIGTAFQNVQANAGATSVTYAASLQSLAVTAGDVFAATALNAVTRVAMGTGRFNLQANAGATGVTYAASMQSLAVTAGDVFAANAVNVATRVAAGGGTTFLRGGTAPAFSALTAADFAAGIITTAALGVTSVSQVGSAAGATSAPLTVSATYVDVPDMSVTFTPSTTCDVLVWFNCTTYNSNPGAVNVIGLSLDGAAEVAEIQPSIPTSNATISPSIAHRFSGVSATAHTVKARWYTNAGTAVMLTTLRRMVVVGLNR